MLKSIPHLMDIDENSGQGPPPSQGGDIDTSFLQQFSCLGTTDHDELILQLQKVLGNQLNYTTARFFLDMNNWYVKFCRFVIVITLVPIRLSVVLLFLLIFSLFFLSFLCLINVCCLLYKAIIDLLPHVSHEIKSYFIFHLWNVIGCLLFNLRCLHQQNFTRVQKKTCSQYRSTLLFIYFEIFFLFKHKTFLFNQLHVNLYKWVVVVVKQLQRNFNSSIVRMDLIMLTMLSLYSIVCEICFTITERNSI